jgi:hypothetical protein
MSWLFGRKSSPDVLRPFVPAWLRTGEEEGFSRSIDGLAAVVRTSGSTAAYRDGAWEIGKLRGSEVIVDGVKVVGAQQAAIPAPAGGGTTDAEARAAIGAILAALRSHGLILS